MRATQARFYVKDIRIEHAVPQRCLRVESADHLYLTEGFVPTHNSASLQNLITGALIRGCHVFIADPTKAAADFQYAKPWAHAMAVTDGEASAMMDHVYAEVVRRKNLNAKYGVASYTDLPADVRPPHIMVVIDEFTSLMFTDRVEKLPANATEEELRLNQQQELSNSNRRNIGGESGRLVREARSAGVTLILAAQELKADTLAKIPGGGSIKNNSSSLLLGKTTFGSRMSALKDAVAAPEIGDDVPKGRGLFESTASSAQVIQSWFDAPDHVASMTEHIAAVRAPLADDERVDLSVMVKTVDEGTVFGRRIDAAEDDGDVVDVPWDGDEIDLGMVDIDFAGMFDDVEGGSETGHSPAAPPAPTSTSAVHAPLRLVFAGPGCEDEQAPEDAIDVDLLPPGDPTTGNGLVDAILARVLTSPGVERIEWVSPAAFDTDGAGVQLYELLEETARMFGVGEVVASFPAGTRPEQIVEELPVVLAVGADEIVQDEDDLFRMQAAPGATAPAPSMMLPAPPVVVVPPPPEFDQVAGDDDMFGAPRRVLSADERF